MNSETKSMLIGTVLGAFFGLAGVCLEHYLNSQSNIKEGLWSSRSLLATYLPNNDSRLSHLQLIGVTTILDKMAMHQKGDLREFSEMAKRAARCNHFRAYNPKNYLKEKCNELVVDGEVCLKRGRKKINDNKKDGEHDDIRVFGNCRGAMNYLIDDL